jgi:hypothetical protein
MIALGAMALAIGIVAPRANAFEVKKSLYTNPGAAGGGAAGAGGAGPTKPNPISPAMQQQLMQILSDESDSYLNQESEKKSSGEKYVDVAPKFAYQPQMKDGKMLVEARLSGTEYQGSKSGTGKGKATGAKKNLVFMYRLDGTKWAEADPPKWVDVAPDATAKKK